MASADDFCGRCQLPRAMCEHRLSVTVPLAEGDSGLAAAPGFWARCLELALAGMARDVGPLIASRYPGRCRTCAGRWEPGDFIAFDQDEDSWICADCAA